MYLPHPKSAHCLRARHAFLHEDGRTAMTARDEPAAEDSLDAITDALLTASRLLVAISARSIAHVDETITIPQFRAPGNSVGPRPDQRQDPSRPPSRATLHHGPHARAADHR